MLNKNKIRSIVDTVFPQVILDLGKSKYGNKPPTLELHTDIYARVSGIEGATGEHSHSSEAEYDDANNKIYIYWPNMKDEKHVIQSILHEYTHTLQDPSKWKKYRESGYENNPFEKEARKAEKNWKKYKMLNNKNEAVRIKLFEEWSINEKNQDYLNKVNFLLAGEKIEGLTGKNNKRIYGKINDICLDDLFNAFYAEGDHGKDLDVNPSLPIIYYGGNKPESIDFLKKYKVKEDVMYNIPSQMKMSGNKSEFYKMFDGSWWLPKSVYSVKDTEKLNFPVIGKPDGEHSGIGIKIFDKFEDIKKSKLKFDNFSEAKDLAQEFRVLLMNDKICLANERISNVDNEMRDKKPEEQTEFVYVDQELDKLDFLDDVLEISEEIRKKIKLGLWSIDIMIDTDGKLWVAEINSASGMAADKMAKVYIMIYEDFYGEELPKDFKKFLFDEYIKPVYDINAKINGKSIKKSKGAVDYFNL